MKRRKFIQNTAAGAVGATFAMTAMACTDENKKTRKPSQDKKPMSKKMPNLPIAICTWQFTNANKTAGDALENGKPALEAAIEGVSIEEQNLKNTTVGKGGIPDRQGNVTLDACVMATNGDCGAVMAVSSTSHVAALARKVMEDTPHVILVGEGAEEFAALSGFETEDLLTEESKKAWQEWLKSPEYKPLINIENHDTIGMLTMDKKGDIAGACTSSGLSYKMKGRVGDSPIIGSGLFLDNEIGGAVATGMGEEVVKTVGSFLIVELMRNGMSPQDACEEAIKRIVNKNDTYKDFQIAYIAMNKMGETGAYCIHEGFTMMKYENKINENVFVDFYHKPS
ncbi:N(4)-(beta-N-acetylglucosaminyl)-L-asparaginase [Rasiella sp. SM2506]|uniref:N(4)-(beta-N-acetylglucosaminyl)-L-asparaginase n=1 Tax=Rasiella sp. SM2506 TaxID=3423914 RepID=UPI003D7C0F50